LEQIINGRAFWQNPISAYQTVEEITDLLLHTVKQYQQWHSTLRDAKAALELLEILADPQLLQEAKTSLSLLSIELDRIEIEHLLSGKYDRNGAYLTITGKDSVEMLLRMYASWAKSHGYKLSWVAESLACSGVINYAIVEIHGIYPDGYLKSETGIHKLERILPENANSIQTSLVRVEVTPICNESEFEIPQQDLEIILPLILGNTNKLEVWVRVVHIPTGIAVYCDCERNRHQNKEKALSIVKSKLWALANSQGVKQIADIQPHSSQNLPSQEIRRYIFDSKMVLDIRTGLKTTALTEVINGKIDPFIRAYLQQECQ